MFLRQIKKDLLVLVLHSHLTNQEQCIGPIHVKLNKYQEEQNREDGLNLLTHVQPIVLRFITSIFIVLRKMGNFTILSNVSFLVKQPPCPSPGQWPVQMANSLSRFHLCHLHSCDFVVFGLLYSSLLYSMFTTSNFTPYYRSVYNQYYWSGEPCSMRGTAQ